MTDRRKHDDPLAGLIARTLAAGSGRVGDVCPDPEILAAFFDRSLPAVESARWEPHFSQCNRCQEQLAVLARMEPATRPSEQPQAPGFTWLWNWRWLAPAAAALGVLAIWVVLRPIENVAPTSPQPVATTAENRQPPSKLNDEAALRADQPTEGDSAKKQHEVSATPQHGRLEAGTKLADQNAPLAPLQMKPSQTNTDALAKDRDQPAAALTPLAEPQQDAQARAAESKERAAEMQIAGRAQQQATQSAEKREVQLGALRSGPVTTQDGNLTQAPAPMRARAPESDQKAREAEAAKKSEVAAAAPAAETTTRAKAKADAASGFRANESASRYATVSVAGTRTLWRVGPEGSIERSQDAGSTWQRQMSGISTDLLTGSAPSATVCWVVGRGGVVLRTTDGAAWAQIGSPSSADLVSVEAQDANQATVTTADGKRYATSDGGRTWRSL